MSGKIDASMSPSLRCSPESAWNEHKAKNNFNQGNTLICGIGAERPACRRRETTPQQLIESSDATIGIVGRSKQLEVRTLANHVQCTHNEKSTLKNYRARSPFRPRDVNLSYSKLWYSSSCLQVPSKSEGRQNLMHE